MITIATCLWAANNKSFSFSRGYDESWVEKLYAGAARHLTQPFRFVCFSDRPRTYAHAAIEHEDLDIHGYATYADFTQPYRLNAPMILVGLDTVIVGNIDHLAEHCLTSDRIAVPRDPFFPKTVCNGVALVPKGKRAEMYDICPKGENDMEWVRQRWRDGHLDVIDDLYPGQVVSYKGEIAKQGLGEDTRMVFFHGWPKPPQLLHVGWVHRHWHEAAA